PETLEFLTVVADGDLLVGRPPDWFGEYVFGGFVIAQAIAAATTDAPEGRRLHSLHCYFLRPVSTASSVAYDVAPVRDGRSFTTRRLAASQEGKAVLDMSCSFTADTDGYAYDLRKGEPPPSVEDLTVEQGPGPWAAG